MARMWMFCGCICNEKREKKRFELYELYVFEQPFQREFIKLKRVVYLTKTEQYYKWHGNIHWCRAGKYFQIQTENYHGVITLDSKV